MLARVTTGADGIAEYLRDGIKSGRELGRDELDLRVCLDGNLELTDSIIKSMKHDGRDENYYHITLSFAESDIDTDVLSAVYNDYKNTLLTAFNDNEFNIYAEAHLPKVKSYRDKKTGEVIERLPHVHIVIPKLNLSNDKDLKPFGFYKSNQDYFVALQEGINNKFGLISPYDRQRPFSHLIDKSDFISRYKGDVFKGSNSKTKSELFDLINDKDIFTKNDFVSNLKKLGEVGYGKKGTSDEYLKFKPNGELRFIRLTDDCFKDDYIKNRNLVRPKPTKKFIDSKLKDWVEYRADEVKYIDQASPKVRKEYYSIKNKEQRKLFLQSKVSEHYKQARKVTARTPIKVGKSKSSRAHRFSELSNKDVHDHSVRGSAKHSDITTKDSSNVSKSNQVRTNRYIQRPQRRSHSCKPSSRKPIPRKPQSFAKIHHGLSGLPQLSVDAARRQRRVNPQELLPSHQDNNLRRQRSSQYNKLRRGIHDGRGRLNRGYFTASDTYSKDMLHRRESLMVQYLCDSREASHMNDEIHRYREIHLNLRADNLLSHLSVTHSLDSSTYGTYKARNGSWRIKTDRISYNVSDFLTKHIGLAWDDAKEILKETYRNQKNENINDKNYKINRHAINSIVFASDYVTRGTMSESKMERLDESLRIFRFLQNQQSRKGGFMPLDSLQRLKVPFSNDNSIQNGNESISFEDSAKRFKDYNKLAESLNRSALDIVASKNIKDKLVQFRDSETGKKVFTDLGEKIVFSSRNPDIKHVAVALELAAEKFGSVRINGTKEFKNNILDVAVAKDLNIVFRDKSMQQEFLRRKEESKSMSISNPSLTNGDDGAVSQQQNQKVVKSDSGDGAVSPLQNQQVIKSHGVDNYQHDPDESKSYFIEFQDGTKLWGVGLKDAVKDSGASEGDVVEVERTGYSTVSVPVKSKNEDGDTVTVHTDVKRADWHISVIGNVRDERVDQNSEGEGKERKVVDSSDSVSPKATAAKMEDSQNGRLYNVEYKTGNDGLVHMTINGDHPGKVPPEVLQNIRQSDPFLRNYDVAALQSGSFDRKVSGIIQPVPKSYDSTGKSHSVDTDTKALKM